MESFLEHVGLSNSRGQMEIAPGGKRWGGGEFYKGVYLGGAPLPVTVGNEGL